MTKLAAVIVSYPQRRTPISSFLLDNKFIPDTDGERALVVALPTASRIVSFTSALSDILPVILVFEIEANK